MPISVEALLGWESVPAPDSPTPRLLDVRVDRDLERGALGHLEAVVNLHRLSGGVVGAEEESLRLRRDRLGDGP